MAALIWNQLLLLLIVLVDLIWIILSLFELLLCTFAPNRSIALKMTFLCKFKDGSMIFFPW